VSQTIPTVSLAPSPINLTPSITWSPGFFVHQSAGVSPATVGGGSARGGLDTLFFDNRATTLGLQTPLRIGPWNWSNSFGRDRQHQQPAQQFDIPDSTVPGDAAGCCSTRRSARPSIGKPGSTAFAVHRTWKLQPGIAIVNQTSAGPFISKSVHQRAIPAAGQALQFNAGLSPTFFGFLPGIGPIARIRHAISPLISYAYAPGSTVDSAFAFAVDPTRRNFTVRSDPQQTISLGLSQNFEAKLKPAPGDTTQRAARKIRLLSINTSSLSYNFEQAKQPGHTGWQTSSISNSFASDLLPGFSLTMSHDLWRGQVGTDTAKFDPFLTNVSAQFRYHPRDDPRHRRPLRAGGRGASKQPRPLPRLPEPRARRVARPRGSVGGSWGCRSAAGAEGSNLSLNYTRIRTRPQADTGFVPGGGGVSRWDSLLSFQRRPIGRRPGIPTTILTRGSSGHFIRLEATAPLARELLFSKAPTGNSHSALRSPCSTSRTSSSITSSSRSPLAVPFR